MSQDPDRIVSLDRWPPAPTGYSGGHGRSLRQYESPAGLCEKAIWLIIGSTATGLIYAVVRSEISDPISLSDVLAFLGVTFLDCVALIAAQVFFLIWVYRVSANLRAFGAEGLSISPAWAVGYFFIPVLNLYKPYSAMRDAWQASEPGLDLATRPESWWRVPSDPRVGWWWTAVLLYPVVGDICAFLAIKFSLTMPTVFWILWVVRVVVSVATIVFMMALTQRQEEAYHRLAG